MLARGTPKTPFSLKNFIAGMTCPTPGAPYIPRRWRPQPPAHPEQRRTTGSNAGRARCKADHATHRHTRQDAGHATPVCTRYQTATQGRSYRRHGGGGRGACNTCMLHTQHFYVLVRLILNILLTCTFNHV